MVVKFSDLIFKDLKLKLKHNDETMVTIPLPHSGDDFAV